MYVHNLLARSCSSDLIELCSAGEVPVREEHHGEACAGVLSWSCSSEVDKILCCTVELSL
jgi:hypothetical protein